MATSKRQNSSVAAKEARKQQRGNGISDKRREPTLCRARNQIKNALARWSAAERRRSDSRRPLLFRHGGCRCAWLSRGDAAPLLDRSISQEGADKGEMHVVDRHGRRVGALARRGRHAVVDARVKNGGRRGARRRNLREILLLLSHSLRAPRHGRRFRCSGRTPPFPSPLAALFPDGG